MSVLVLYFISRVSFGPILCFASVLVLDFIFRVSFGSRFYCASVLVLYFILRQFWFHILFRVSVLCLLACQVRVTVGDSSLRGCVCVASSERLLVDLVQ